MNKLLLASLLAAATAATTLVAQTSGPEAQVQTSSSESGPWEVRLRATYLSMANKSDAFSALGIDFPSDAVTVNSKWIPELDISYYFTSHFSAELVLTVPQTQNVSLQGVGSLGTFKHLPPVLTAQYHFLPGVVVDPYVGVGVNYTLIWGGDLQVAGVPLGLSGHSVGLAGQIGADISVARNTVLNVDVKKVGLSSDVYAPGAYLTTARLDPLLLSVGIGWRF